MATTFEKPRLTEAFRWRWLQRQPPLSLFAYLQRVYVLVSTPPRPPGLVNLVDLLQFMYRSSFPCPKI